MVLQPALPEAPPASLPLEVFRARRARLLDGLGPAAAVIVPAPPELLSSRDTDVPYRPGSDLYYLTGLLEPSAVAVLTTREGAAHLALFVRPREPEREVWTGERLGVDGAAAATGADEVHPVNELADRLYDLVSGSARLHYPFGVDAELDVEVQDLIVRARRLRPRSGRGPVGIEDLDATLGALRRVKDLHEIERMRAAAAITVAGHRAAMGAVRVGGGEWEVQAALEATFRRCGAEGPAFPSIVGSGPNATTLHYTANARRIEPGDLVLVDAGASYGLYAADLTRTFPASGRFSGPQREIYGVVLAAEKAAIEVAAPGGTVGEMHGAAVRVLAEGLLRLGLVEGNDIDGVIESGVYRRYFMHQTSHWLGLDVHDVGMYRERGRAVPLEAGMVLTVEPGLYLPADDTTLPERYRGIGVRIEDTIVITSDGAELLTGAMPREVEEVEALAR